MTPFDKALSKIHAAIPNSELYDAQVRPILECLIHEELGEFVEKIAVLKQSKEQQKEELKKARRQP